MDIESGHDLVNSKCLTQSLHCAISQSRGRTNVIVSCQNTTLVKATWWALHARGPHHRHRHIVWRTRENKKCWMNNRRGDYLKTSWVSTILACASSLNLRENVTISTIFHFDSTHKHCEQDVVCRCLFAFELHRKDQGKRSDGWGVEEHRATIRLTSDIFIWFQSSENLLEAKTLIVGPTYILLITNFRIKKKNITVSYLVVNHERLRNHSTKKGCMIKMKYIGSVRYR